MRSVYEVKAFLMSYMRAYKNAEQLQREKDIAHEVSVKSPRFDGMPRTPSQRGLDEEVARIIGIDKRADEAREQVLRMAEQIERMIESLTDDRQKRVIRLRYMYGLKWAEIEQTMCLTQTPLMDAHRAALVQIWKAGDENRSD